MARIFITGSSDGLGFLAGRQLVEQGHRVVLHARSAARAEETKKMLPACDAVVVGDVSTLAAMRSVAEQANALGRFDAVIHNVGLGTEQAREETADGMTKLYAVNVAAPYVLTALMTRPERLIYLSSGLHSSGHPGLEDPQWKSRRWNGLQAYSDTKLHDVILAMGLARRWSGTTVHAVDPGWVPTRMGGPGAPDDLAEGAATQAWLAVSDDSAARKTGGYFHHLKLAAMNSAAGRASVQDGLLTYLRSLTGVELPAVNPS
jgi:NAD(P)-dependent dehydrogenase (short-subunit alcohol dehydrogenase family)